MSIFGSIMGKIFGTTPAEAAPATAPAAADAAPAAADAAAAPAADAPAAPAAAAPAGPPVDVTAMLDDLADKSDEELNWRTSIVDMMKLLKLDSSLTARKTLAKELNYTGDMDDSATMNVWLHKQVMEKIAANGGTLPADLH